MDLLLAWFLAPVGLLATVVGLALILERATGFALPWTVRPALGMAAMIVLAQFGTATAFTAKLTLPALLVVAAAGIYLGRAAFRDRPGLPEVAVALGVFLLYASPFLVSGEATWAGYIKLDDNATWLLITEHVFEHGRGLIDLPPSTHQQVLVDYLGGTYPIGGFVPMALMSQVSGEDVAFLLQPSMAAAAAMLALLLLELARGLLRSAGAAAFVAVVASLSALLLGYYLWGGVKELVMAVLLPLGPLLAAQADRAGWPARSWAPLAVTIAAIVCVLGPGGALWAIPPLIPFLVLVLREGGRERALRLAAPIAAGSLLLVLPVVFGPTGPFDPLNGGINESAGLGNLFAPIDLLQGTGIWPSLDFRLGAELEPATKAVAAAVAIAAFATAVLAPRRLGRRAAALLGYVAGGALAVAVIVWFASAWVDGKVLATISPGILAAALIGVLLVGERTSLRLEARATAGLVALFVAWGAVLAFQGAWIAPRSHHDELEKIGSEFAGRGPALSTEVSIYGPRHFLTGLDAEGASDRRRRPVTLVTGAQPDKGVPVDLDEVRSAELAPYNLFVTRRGPATSRPPAEFSLVRSTEHYDVWERDAGAAAAIEHLPLGGPHDAGAQPPCSQVRRLAEVAGEGGRLVAARVGTPFAVELGPTESSSGWAFPTPYTFVPDGSGRLSGTIDVPAGTYELWLGGQVLGGLTIYLDGEAVATQRGALNNSGGMERLGTVPIGPGEQPIELAYESGGPHPGAASTPYEIGPLELRAPQRRDLGTVTVAPSRYADLCGQRWDWIEAHGP